MLDLNGCSLTGDDQTTPSFGLITNVGKAHLLGFGSFEGVKATKGELYDNLLAHRKIAFVNDGSKDRTLEMDEVQGWIDTILENLKNIGIELRA